MGPNSCGSTALGKAQRQRLPAMPGQVTGDVSEVGTESRAEEGKEDRTASGRAGGIRC